MTWTLRKKIFLGYGITLALMVLILIWAFVNLRDLGQASDAILRENYRSILAAENMVYALERQDSAILLIFSGLRKKGGSNSGKMKASSSSGWEGPKITSRSRARIKLSTAIETGYAAYLHQVSEIKPISISGSRKTATLYHETILPSFLQVRSMCIRLREINQETMYRASNRASVIAQKGHLVHGRHWDCRAGDRNRV